MPKDAASSAKIACRASRKPIRAAAGYLGRWVAEPLKTSTTTKPKVPPTYDGRDRLLSEIQGDSL